ncbi:hypothetical protein [Paenibacillus glycanilyticus]|uniref:Peptidylprolyl isomerase n=1 Tax=Paenibacillus glycanilyticus TaxID=126569 RepID=A0ABQ6GAK0_9BACL|nr:hypothetical protein [Paenibacillus glycanilyticus]GLX67268.1 hypothetical protein MU1_16130 [Paenibacillus glycanilyticus]
MSELNEKELVSYLAERTKVPAATISLVLKHEQAFIEKAQSSAKGEIVDIDSDELVDYVLKQRDVKLDELTVEKILDMEMDYLVENGLAEQED